MTLKTTDAQLAQLAGTDALTLAHAATLEPRELPADLPSAEWIDAYRALSHAAQLAQLAPSSAPRASASERHAALRADATTPTDAAVRVSELPPVAPVALDALRSRGALLAGTAVIGKLDGERVGAREVIRSRKTLRYVPRLSARSGDVKLVTECRHGIDATLALADAGQAYVSRVHGGESFPDASVCASCKRAHGVARDALKTLRKGANGIRSLVKRERAALAALSRGVAFVDGVGRELDPESVLSDARADLAPLLAARDAARELVILPDHFAPGPRHAVPSPLAYS